MTHQKNTIFDNLFIATETDPPVESTAARCASAQAIQDRSQGANGDFHIAQHAKNATARFEDKVDQALSWLLPWHYSTPRLIDLLVSESNKVRSTDFIQKLKKRGLVTCRESGLRGLKNLPTKLVFLTGLGIDRARANSNNEFKPCITPRFDPKYLDHHLTVQKLTLGKWKSGEIGGCIPETQIPAGQDVAKIPDAVWMVNLGDPPKWLYIAVELELTPKYGRDFDRFCSESYKALAHGVYGALRIYSRSKTLLQRYRATLRIGGKVNTWSKDDNGIWIKGQPIVFEDEVIEKVSFYPLNDD